MGINVKNAKRVITRYRVEANEMCHLIAYDPKEILEIIENIVEALAEPERKICPRCSGPSPMHTRECLKASLGAQKQEETPQFEVGDIVTIKNGAVGNVHQVVEVGGIGGAVRIQSLDEPYPFGVEAETLTPLFPASQLPNKLSGYMVGDVVEFVSFQSKKPKVGQIAYILPNADYPFTVFYWDGDWKMYHSTIKEIIRKLWPAEKA